MLPQKYELFPEPIDLKLHHLFLGVLLLDLARSDHVFPGDKSPSRDVLIVELGIDELLYSIVHDCLLRFHLPVSQVLHEIVGPSQCQGISIRERFRQFLCQKLFVRGLRAEHLEKLQLFR